MTNKKPISKNTDYGAKDIYVLEGLSPVRKRPAMYIGSTGLDGLLHLIWEVVDNGIDECMGGHADEITVILLPGNRISVEDNGRGIPVDIHPQTKKSALETVMTTLHAGGKFGGDAYKVSGGLHGVGVSVVCALSTWTKAEICRGGFKYVQEYKQGKPQYKVKKTGACKSSGTTITFESDPEIFREIKFDIKKIINHLRQQAYLTKGVKINIIDNRENQNLKYTFYFEGGIRSYVKHLVKGVVLRHPNTFYAIGEKNGILVEVAFQYTQEYECYEESFANNIWTREGGTHLTGFRGALTRTFNDYAKKNNILKESDDNLSGEDTREGLTAIVSVKVAEPQFEGQTKAKLGNPEARVAVEGVVAESLTDYLERNPNDARTIIEKCLLSQKARKAAKTAKETILRKGALDGLSLPGKLADCVSRKPEESELFLVEGDSAGGCFSGDTKVALTDGRNLTFKELIREHRKSKKNYCYTIKEDGRVGVGLIEDPRKTKKNVKVIKIILDNKEEIICTPDHLFMLNNGEYKKAENLAIEDSLMPLYRKHSKIKEGFKIEGYEIIYNLKNNKWVYTHSLGNEYNIDNKIYPEVGKNSCVHHKDFNKLNNNPDNLIQMDKQEHLKLHSKVVKETMSRPEILEKIRKAHQSKKYREKIRAIMLKPEMRKLLSKRAKKQWENEGYKKFMNKKFLEFYRNNKDYRELNNKLLNESQKKYWAKEENRKKQAERVRKYFEENPELREEYSLKSKKQWQNNRLLDWRREETKKQWTSEFRTKRKKAYNHTYKEKALKLMKGIIEKHGNLDKEKYNQQRLEIGDKSILRFDTICQRFFQNQEEKLEEAVLKYNHKIKKIIKLREKIDVYDIEVSDTHNFALASGVFVHNSSRQARDRRSQAILPLRGKILNVEKARLDKILSSKEIKSLIIAMGTAIAEDFNLDKIRYHRVILTLDADVDGSHIRTLLLTLFYRYFKPIIDAGYLYIAQPPLYKIQTGKKIDYAYTEAEKTKIVDEIKKTVKTTPNVQRFKGLGEMNSQELWETTMNPENRKLLRISIKDGREADKIFDTLMGDDVMPRKKFIQTHAKQARNLDI